MVQLICSHAKSKTNEARYIRIPHGYLNSVHRVCQSAVFSQGSRGKTAAKRSQPLSWPGTRVCQNLKSKSKKKPLKSSLLMKKLVSIKNRKALAILAMGTETSSDYFHLTCNLIMIFYHEKIRNSIQFSCL